MDEYYIKENNRWTGPFVQSEFEVKIAGMDEVVFWKRDFCPNQILHPALCSHFKTMSKTSEAEHEEPDIRETTSAKEQVMGSEETSTDKITTTQERPEEQPKEEPEEISSGLAENIHSGNNGKKSELKPEPETTAPKPEAISKTEEKAEKPVPEEKPEAPEKESVTASVPKEKTEEPTPKEEPEPKIAEAESVTDSVSQEKKEEPTAEKEPEPLPGKKISEKPEKEKKLPETTAQKPAEPESKAVEEKPVKEKTSKTRPPVEPVAKETDKQGYLLKMAVIVIGFLLVILAGFYVNSRLSVVKYQDTIIRNYIEEIDNRTNEIVKEQQVLQKKMDSLKLLLGKELKALKEIQGGAFSGNGKK